MSVASQWDQEAQAYAMVAYNIGSWRYTWVYDCAGLTKVVGFTTVCDGGLATAWDIQECMCMCMVLNLSLIYRNMIVATVAKVGVTWVYEGDLAMVVAWLQYGRYKSYISCIVFISPDGWAP